MKRFDWRNSRKRGALFVTCTIALGMLLVACSTGDKEVVSMKVNREVERANEGSKKVTIIRNLKSDSLDPLQSWEPLRAGITETLVRLDANMKLVPWLASEWRNVDELTWVFTIRDNITFHNGTQLDANGVKASLEEAIRTNKSIALSLKIASLSAEGQKLTIKTAEPYPALPSELVNPYMSIIDAGEKARMGADAFNTAPIGTGPFTVKAFKPNIEITLERYDHYWDGLAKVNEVSYKFNEDSNMRSLALQSKEADIVYQLPAENIATIEKDSSLRVKSISGLRVYLLMFNQQTKEMSDLRVRKAIDRLIDREGIVNGIMIGNGTKANGPFHASLPFGSQVEPQSLRVEEAKSLLQEAGYIQGKDDLLYKDGKPLTLDVVTYKGRPELPLIAQLLQSDAAKVGITIRIQVSEDIDAHLRDNKEWEVATYAILSSPRGDGGYFLNAALTPGGSINPANIEVKGLNEVLSKLNRTSDIEDRISLTKQATEIIQEQLPHAYAVYPNLIVGVNDRIISWEPGAEEYYIVTNKLDVR
ncbi:nickel ABC transporter substrate-binding protein [Paenibacillus sp. L3-i20]|uniref:nickel ABC transporter substrate-binding protein n=1 Tax=Paenibacillus sp. L3-i20 TaxID=2905833 RepID=UPI001EDD1F8D|nr:nickel ABC transporter substrate-binding protein [Paenibacillus sp. L3-i20]GKU78278.1 ABC transporter substrate-binding protein [Paenibacillus sp. L3-i20]